MKRKTISMFVLCFTVSLMGFLSSGRAQNIEDRKYVCMVQDSLQIKAGTPIEIAGNTYYGCCSMCAGKMKANSVKYTKAKDPVSGVVVDKSLAFIFGYEGNAYYFASEDTRRQFSNNPATYLEKSK